jgi:hypothetical protein
LWDGAKKWKIAQVILIYGQKVYLLILNIVGTHNVTYGNIAASGLSKPPSKAIIDKLSISVGKLVNASVCICLGVKDKPIRLSDGGYVRRLKLLRTQYVVIWDETERRGWLVSGCHALLHLVRESLEVDKKDDEGAGDFLYGLDGADTVLQEGKSPYRILMNEKNRQLRLYLENTEVKKLEASLEDEVGLENGVKISRTYRILEHLVLELMEALEKRYAIEQLLANDPGYKIDPKFGDYLQGCDFRSLARQDRLIFPLQTKVAKLGSKGWVDIIRAIGATVLFGAGFGDILRPVTGVRICHSRKTLPKDENLLAITVADVMTILETFGDSQHDAVKILNQNVVNHSSYKLFESCFCSGHGNSARCDYAQMRNSIVDRDGDSGTFNPLEQYPDGAIVLGHCSFFEYYIGSVGRSKTEKMKQVSRPVEGKGEASAAHNNNAAPNEVDLSALAPTQSQRPRAASDSGVNLSTSSTAAVAQNYPEAHLNSNKVTLRSKLKADMKRIIFGTSKGKQKVPD